MYRSFRYWGFLNYGPFGPVPARLLPIFRDRDELKAGGRPGPEVERALSVIRSLIVPALRRRFDDTSGSGESAPIAADPRRDDDGWLLAIHKINR